MTDATVLDRLWETIESRRGADPTLSPFRPSAVTRHTQDRAEIRRGGGVECVIEAVRGEDRAALIAESADVLYHLLVLWVDAEVRPEEVWAELARREGTSGIAEKASRS